ncbi:probable DNA-directed RNA polymerases I and III subunit RPAC2 isoform X2 [Ischnura elegans]|uniref:probable DNA-directed RNA polymerases I and III subunit RPAC2 isoform X2 n=1 Tax=Ischnura elegans TaxID=197161 RepID=UPI001ED8B248|nr:probable DNA-directed RNA polymerases I and III subunit RPAC2 isoform X2 [Ischnura elegans]
METDKSRRLVLLAGDDKSNDKCRTFVFHHEDHTLGNALKSVICRYPDVELCAYSMPHPFEPKMLLRIQTYGPSAIDVLKRGLRDLEEICAHTLGVYEEELVRFQTSSSRSKT